MNQSPPNRPANSPTGQRSGLALASLILGICGIALCLGPLAGIPAVICGHMAQTKIKQSGGALGGAGLATAGLITGYISITLIFVMGLLAAIAIPNFVKARNKAQFNACQNNLRMIQGTKEMWALENKRTENDVPADADIFGATKTIKEAPACPAGGSYSLNAVKDNPRCSKHGSLGER